MTVSSTTNRKAFTGDAVTTSFGTSPVVFFETSELVVQVVVAATGVTTTLTENTDYTVSGGDGTTGTVNLAGGSDPYGAPAATDTLVIRRVLPFTQTDDFVNNDINDAEVLEDNLDRSIMLMQQLDEEQGRALKVASSEGEQTDIAVAGKAGYYLRRNLAGTAFELIAGDPNDSTFTASGTGAVERSVSAKEGDIIDAKDYGTLQQALTAAAGKVLHITSDLTVTDIVAVAANTTVIFWPSTLTFSNAAAAGDIRLDGQNINLIGMGGKINFASIQCICAAAAANVDNLNVQGLTVTCSTPGAGHGIQINTTGTADNITIKNNRWVDCRHSVLLNDGPSTMGNIVVTENRIEGCHRDGIQINRPTLGATDFIVTDNMIEMDATGSGLTSDGFAISIEQCVRGVIANNVVKFSRREGIHLDGSAGTDDINDQIVIDGNVILSGRDGILVNEPATYLVISNNICTKSGSAAQGGISIISDDETSLGNFTITGNVVKGYEQGVYGGFGGEAIPIIQSNYISDCTKGIDIERAYQCQGVSGNVIEDCTVGIETASGGVVGKNIFRDVTTICDNTGERATFLKGFSVIKTGISTANGSNTAKVVDNLFTSAARAYGWASMTWFDETSNTSWALRKNELTWDGSSLTSTGKFNTSGGGVLSTTAFQVADDDLEVTCANSGGTITTSISLDFDGDLLVL